MHENNTHEKYASSIQLRLHRAKRRILRSFYDKDSKNISGVDIAKPMQDLQLEQNMHMEQNVPAVQVNTHARPAHAAYQIRAYSIGKRVLASFSAFLFLLLFGIFGATTIISYGPSPTARDLLITSLLETSALKFVAYMYFDEAEIENIIANNSVQVSDVVTDTDLIHFEENEDDETEEPLVIEIITGDTFSGEMLIVQDPSRVFVGTSADAYTGENGKTVQEIINRYGGIGGTNAGGFADEGGIGNGGTPLGIVISEGELRAGSLSSSYDVIGIDEDNKLIVGTMTAQEALDRNIRDAVSFGPALIVNGEMMEITGQGGGLNPRTAIGQRSDGAMLLLVCDGRQANSIGASMGDVAEVMAQYGAVNAANLDGGSSTIMYFEDELVNVSSSLYGPRDIPTAIVISPELTGGD